MKTQPKHLWTVFTTFIRSASGGLRSVSLRSLLVATLEGFGLVLIVWLALKHYRQPVNEKAQLVFIALWVLNLHYYISKQSPGFVRRLRVVLYGYTALLVVLVFLGNFGDVAIEQIGYLGLFLAAVISIKAISSIGRKVSNQHETQPEKGQRDIQAVEWRYGMPVYEKPDEKLTDISTAAWLWQQSGIMSTHRMLENLEKALQRVGYELTREQESNTNILSGPAQMRPHLRKRLEAELLRARELYWAPDQSQEMVEDTIRISQKSGFGQKMLEDILNDLRKRGWRLRKLKTDRELENWPLQQVVIRLSAQPGTRLTDIVRCLRRITGYVRDNELPQDTQKITHTGEFHRDESEKDPWPIHWEVSRRQCDTMPGFFPRNGTHGLPPYFDDGMNEYRISLAIHLVLIVQGTRSTRPEFLAADIEQAISSIETGYQQGAIFNDDSGYAFCCQGRPFN